MLTKFESKSNRVKGERQIQYEGKILELIRETRACVSSYATSSGGVAT